MICAWYEPIWDIKNQKSGLQSAYQIKIGNMEKHVMYLDGVQAIQLRDPIDWIAEFIRRL